MKIQPAKVESFIKKPDQNICGFLIYGPDSGLVSLRAKALHHTLSPNPTDPFLNTELSYKNIKKDPALLGDELYAGGLIKGRRSIKITDTENSLITSISQILKEYRQDNITIWIAEELPPTSSLRKLFENESHLAAIACYKDDSTSLKPVIMQYLKERSFNATIEAIDLLSHRFSGDRLVVLSELEKLMTFKGKEPHITADDVMNCIGDNIELSLDTLCHAVASGDIKQIEPSLHRAYEEHIATIAIIRTLIYYFTRLHFVRALVDGGQPIGLAVTEVKPPIFFKNIPLFKQHIQLWNDTKLGLMLNRLHQLEQQCKQNIVPGELLLGQFLSLSPLTFKIRS